MGKNLNFRRKSKFQTKIEIFRKNRNFRRKSKFQAQIEISFSKFYGYIFQVVYIRPEETSSPSVAGEWLDGTRQVVQLKDANGDEIRRTFELLSHQSTADETILRHKSTSTQLPSIQGRVLSKKTRRFCVYTQKVSIFDQN